MTTTRTSTVETTLGSLRGRITDDGVHQFRGVPYARAPIGDRRFAAPEPPEPWTGTRDATRFGPAAPQPAPRSGSPLPGRPTVSSEDCLFLNIYTPSPDDALRPVLVWFHGGGYTSGSSDLHDGEPFARDGDLVVVTVNYRLGVLGFMELGHLDPRLAGSQNNGIRDQIAALQWVHDHIGRFGGDPGQVTISGGSAGAGSVVAILASPAADHLYQRAIAQSAPASFGPPDTGFADAVVAQFGDSLARLRSADPADVLAAQERVMRARAVASGVALAGRGIGMQPAIDDHTITRSPTAVDGPDVAKPLLTGTNVDEGTLFSFTIPRVVDDADLRAAVAAHTDDPDAVVAAFAATHPGESNRRLMVRMLTDTLFRTSSLRVADARVEAGGTVFVYLFTWPSRGFGGRLGAMHALEIPFVWRQDTSAWAPVMGEGEPWPDDLADRMHRAWTAFVRTGDPSHDGIGTWPAYDRERRPTMEFGETSGVLDDPLGATRAAWH